MASSKGNWDRAHCLIQGEKTMTGAWVRAFLHRVEGDNANAGYWYYIAGRSPGMGSLSAEWREIADRLLETPVEPALEMHH